MPLLARLFILLCLVSSPAFAQTLTSVDCAAVFDDDGTRVGRVHEVGDTKNSGDAPFGSAVLFDVDGIVFPVRVTTHGLKGNFDSNRL
jgi:hypothetical protein